MSFGAVALLLAILGNVVLWATLLGLVYRVGMRQRVWRTVAGVGIACAVVTSGLMLRQVGLRGPKLLTHNRWQHTPTAWRATVIACASGSLAWMVLAGTRRFRYRTPSLIAQRISAVDVADVLGGRPGTPGLGRLVARLPGNEVYRLDVIEVELRPPRLPPQLDGLAIVHLSDLHLNGTPGRAYFEHVCETAAGLRPDMFVVTGDILDRAEMSAWLATTLARLRGPVGNFFVLGNHDVDAGVDHVRAAMAETGWTSVGGGGVTSLDIRGGRVLIAGTERPWIGTHPQLPLRSPDEFRILLSHTPYNLRWARRNHFDLMLAGHLHGGQIVRRRHLCGVIERPPTILHLSRGVGEMSPPIRLGCRPEITRLVLTA